MKTAMLQKKWGRLLTVTVLVIAAAVTVWAMRKQWFTGKKTGEGMVEKWTPIAVDPWQELDRLVNRLQESVPYTQTGKLLLKNEYDSLLEEKNFRMTYYGNHTIVYQLAGIEMLQTPDWQAVIDHDQQLVSVSAAEKKGAVTAPTQFDLSMLKQVFKENRFEWRVLQNETGQRMLVSDDYTNGTITGLQVNYDAPSLLVKYVNMGLPRLVQHNGEKEKKDTAQAEGSTMEVVSESIRFQYNPLQAVTKETEEANPQTYFTIRNKKLVILDKRFERYRFLNAIK